MLHTVSGVTYDWEWPEVSQPVLQQSFHQPHASETACIVAVRSPRVRSYGRLVKLGEIAKQSAGKCNAFQEFLTLG